MLASIRAIRRRLALAAASGLVVLVSACSTSGSTAGGTNGYISGDGTVTTIEPSQRAAAPDLSGPSLDGQPLDLSDYRGKVVVVNVWGAWCAECRAEQDAVVGAAKALKQTQFLGIDASDGAKAADRAFLRSYDVPFPSIYDPDGKALLAFHGTVGPNAIPSTLVLDTQGRVAARVLGQTTQSTLEGLVRDVAKES